MSRVYSIDNDQELYTIYSTTLYTIYSTLLHYTIHIHYTAQQEIQLMMRQLKTIDRNTVNKQIQRYTHTFKGRGEGVSRNHP